DIDSRLVYSKQHDAAIKLAAINKDDDSLIFFIDESNRLCQFDLANHAINPLRDIAALPEKLICKAGYIFLHFGTYLSSYHITQGTFIHVAPDADGTTLVYLDNDQNDVWLLKGMYVISFSLAHLTYQVLLEIRKRSDIVAASIKQKSIVYCNKENVILKNL